MVRIEEDSFPRGGKKVPIAVKRKSENDSLFNSEKPKKQKKNKISEVSNEDIILAALNKKGVLSSSLLHEEMILLASVRNITAHTLDVELPGLLTAKVTITEISNALNISLKKALKSTEISTISELLKDKFKKGQYVPFKLKQIQNNEDETVILGSISPTTIYSGRVHNTFRNGELIWATVHTELDHGYQLDCGVVNCRIFLPIQNVEQGRELKIGEPIWCKVHKVENGTAASTLRVGIKQQHIDSVLTDESIPLNFILPGTKVEVFIEKILPHGIYCKFLDNYVGFIHESQLNPPMQKLSSIKEASVLSAYILFVEDTTKIAHLSLRSLNSQFKQTYARGDKVSAAVMGKNPNGIYLRLNKNERAWISNQRALKSLSKNSNNLNMIKEKFYIGSKHECVILNYNHMDCVYICSLEKELLKEKYFDFKDFTVGESVEGVVCDIKSNGVVLSVGQVRGFIPNIQLTDAMYSHNLKKMFTVGKKLKAKVFSSNEKNVIFTLKSKFLKEEACLSSLEQVDLNRIYPALVLQAKPYGILVAFYNNIEGFVPSEEFNFQVTPEYKNNPSSHFYPGEVIRVRVVKTQPDKIIASLQLNGPKFRIGAVGLHVRAVVKKVLDNGLSVFIQKMNLEGFVPVEHLSIEKSLCHTLLGTFKDGDEFSDLQIIKSDKSGTVLSRREAIAFRRCNLRAPKFENIRKGHILRCSVESVHKNGIFVSSPIKNFGKNIFVGKKFITREQKMPRFEIRQSVIGKVMNINKAEETIVLSLKLEHVFDSNIESSVKLFAEYLADEEYLREFGSQNGWPLNQYKVAEKVLCTIKQISHRGCLVELPNGCQGLVVDSLFGCRNKVGEKVDGIVLGHNYQLKYVELCFDKKLNKSINPNQDGSLPENELLFTINKLLKREQYVLGVLRKAGNRQLVYLPLKLCENDFDNSLSTFYDNDVFKVEICGTYGEKLIGFNKKLSGSLNHKLMIKDKPRSKLEKLLLSTVSKSEETISSQPSSSSETLEVEEEEEETGVSELDDVVDESNNSEVDVNLSGTDDEEESTKEGPELDGESVSDSEVDENISQSGDEEESSMEILELDDTSEADENLSENGDEGNVEVDDESLSDASEDICSKENADPPKEMADTNSLNGKAENNKNEETDEEDDDFQEELDSEKCKQKVTFDGAEVRQYKDQDQICCSQPILPSISNFFSAQIAKKIDDSSSDDDPEEVETKKKKKKLTPTERAEQVRLEEERISKIEKELADSSSEPQSAEHFERILIAEPNSSALWIKYMSHYLALAEFEKARAVGKKALDTINMTLDDEKFNIWIALLNLENLYGTKESFEKLFEDAVKYNDAFQVYMRVLDMLHESGKQIELEEKIKKARLKFKQEAEMWVHVAKIYYLLGKFDEARNTKNACLKSITNRIQQYNLIIKFAILEFTYGEIDIGISIFENIVDTYPNKINSWLVYIDQLVSKHQITEARNLLERAITMNLPLKATKVIYNKYRLFEEKHGTPQSLEIFKERAKQILQVKAKVAE